MAFLLSKSNAFSRHFRSLPQQGALDFSRRGFHVAPGAREKALLAPDPALSRFKSHKKSVKSLRKVFDLLTVAVVAGCCYEIYVKATTREEARSKAGDA